MNPAKVKILVVDDEANHAEAMAEILERVGYQVTVATSGENGIRTLGAETFDIVVTDLKMTPVTGLDVLSHVKSQCPGTEVLLVSGHGSVEQAVEAIKMGAANYLTKPLQVDEVRLRVKEVCDQIERKKNPPIKPEVTIIPSKFVEDADRPFPEFIGESQQLKHIFDIIRKVAPTPATVLVTGANGTGKELVARAIHRQSPRHNFPFVALNCGAMSEAILESELFGHVRGAFTGAVSAREGRFEFADNGTIFLDEIGDMPLSLQVKLLRVVQEREVIRVGANEAKCVDVRIIAATNRILEDEIKQGKFREDLYYRLKVVHIQMPELKERREDIPLLAHHFLREANRAFGRTVHEFEPAAMQQLVNFEWPGNVRQLKNVVDTMVVLASNETLGVDDIPPDVIGENPAGQALLPLNAFDGLSLSSVENYMISHYLKRFEGNRAKVAQALGISERTLYRKLKEFGLN
ncbi:MAG: two-component system response regulator HydG [Planctomycetota bacterium]|jgi:two-component system response regulator HydG